MDQVKNYIEIVVHDFITKADCKRINNLNNNPKKEKEFNDKIDELIKKQSLKNLIKGHCEENKDFIKEEKKVINSLNQKTGMSKNLIHLLIFSRILEKVISNDQFNVQPKDYDYGVIPIGDGKAYTIRISNEFKIKSKSLIITDCIGHNTEKSLKKDIDYIDKNKSNHKDKNKSNHNQSVQIKQMDKVELNELKGYKFIISAKTNDSYLNSIPLYIVLKKQVIRNPEPKKEQEQKKQMIRNPEPKQEQEQKQNNGTEGDSHIEFLMKNEYYYNALDYIRSILNSELETINGKETVVTAFRYKAFNFDISKELQTIKDSHEELDKIQYFTNEKHQQKINLQVPDLQVPDLQVPDLQVPDIQRAPDLQRAPDPFVVENQNRKHELENYGNYNNQKRRNIDMKNQQFESTEETATNSAINIVNSSTSPINTQLIEIAKFIKDNKLIEDDITPHNIHELLDLNDEMLKELPPSVLEEILSAEEANLEAQTIQANLEAQLFEAQALKARCKAEFFENQANQTRYNHTLPKDRQCY